MCELGMPATVLRSSAVDASPYIREQSVLSYVMPCDTSGTSLIIVEDVNDAAGKSRTRKMRPSQKHQTASSTAGCGRRNRSRRDGDVIQPGHDRGASQSAPSPEPIRKAVRVTCGVQTASGARHTTCCAAGCLCRRILTFSTLG